MSCAPRAGAGAVASLEWAGKGQSADIVEGVGQSGGGDAEEVGGHLQRKQDQRRHHIEEVVDRRCRVGTAELAARLMCPRLTSVLVTDVPILAPMMIGMAVATGIAPLPTNATTSDVVVDDDCTRLVTNTPTKSPIRGSDALWDEIADKTAGEHLERLSDHADADQEAIENRREGDDPNRGAFQAPCRGLGCSLGNGAVAHQAEPPTGMNSVAADAVESAVAAATS